jgi:hypothetical protein
MFERPRGVAQAMLVIVALGFIPPLHAAIVPVTLRKGLHHCKKLMEFSRRLHHKFNLCKSLAFREQPIALEPSPGSSTPPGT